MTLNEARKLLQPNYLNVCPQNHVIVIAIIAIIVVVQTEGK